MNISAVALPATPFAPSNTWYFPLFSNFPPLILSPNLAVMPATKAQISYHNNLKFMMAKKYLRGLGSCNIFKCCWSRRCQGWQNSFRMIIWKSSWWQWSGLIGGDKFTSQHRLDIDEPTSLLVWWRCSTSCPTRLNLQHRWRSLSLPTRIPAGCQKMPDNWGGLALTKNTMRLS